MSQISSYKSQGGSAVIIYRGGKLASATAADKIEWDGIKHSVEYYEEDLNLNKFLKIE